MKDVLKIVADNPALFDALKEALKEPFLKDDIISSMPNEIIGQIARARHLALQKIDEAFAKIEIMKTGAAPKQRQLNQAR